MLLVTEADAIQGQAPVRRGSRTTTYLPRCLYDARVMSQTKHGGFQTNSTLVLFLNRMPTFTSWLETALDLASTWKYRRAGLPWLKGSQMPGTTLRTLSNECPSHAVRLLMREP